MKKLVCTIFKCHVKGGNRCCFECEKKESCSLSCLNDPEKCGLSARRTVYRKPARKVICFLLCLSLCWGILPAKAKAPEHITVLGYEEHVDYFAIMKRCAGNGSDYALMAGWIYEQQRNLKIRELGLHYEETDYFSRFHTGKEILAEMEKKPYKAEDLDLLSRVVYAEAGCDWFPDWVQQAVASVVINRVKSKVYPNTIRGVIYQPGQYGCVSNGSFYASPSFKAIENARRILEYGSTLPAGVIGQSGAATGKVHSQYYDSVLGSTIYFCYGLDL